MAPLVYVCVRPQQVAAEAEYASFRTAMGLTPSQLDRIDLTRDALPADAFTRWRGFVVGGSPYNATDAAETKAEAQLRLEADLARIADAAASDRTAALFTCYGIGVATEHLGGEISRDYPEETGPTEVALTDEGRTDPLFGGLPPTFAALTAHKEGTRTLPADAVLLATNPDCPVQAYRVGTRLYATQFHPEPTPRDFTERMTVYRNDGYFDAADYDRIAARVLSTPVTEPTRLLAAFAASF
ncbi:glutamine amidotransferase [Microbacterium imperiale]|uniref:Glutamine amidotransferase n=1 Tax=Microbacterium imperiale TaxID=33884 RepID=A0A9W6HGA2_9MICO|nr:glutamine amidotransferase [Microbacterium imperiale]MBP2420649.1 GMP synthase (glutamine-hydrolyzing) [Microbacterium imperiale]MDS0200470.1 glutamine amidotransferase [Microbacterium imperiale]BFE40989.1 glutamine amidotransferase [Microbacterium imperiale]GLJ80044.1 glutamine amidotransferase [Microbacterium imperiale]